MEDWISSLKSVQSREHYEVRAPLQINRYEDACVCVFVCVCVCVCLYVYCREGGKEIKRKKRERWAQCRRNDGAAFRRILFGFDLLCCVI